MAKSDVLVRMKADTQGYDANIAKARRQLDQFKKDNLTMGGVLKQLNGNLLATAARFASVGAAVGALGAAFKSNIETARGFEKSMSQLSSLTGMVGEDLNRLKEYSIELGASTTLSASQVADAFKMIGSQQPQLLSSGEALKAVTKNAITLAEAAGIELADAAKTLSVSINQMGGDSANAERYINVLAAASQKGAGDIVWLGEAITKSGTTAKAVGTDYEELVANLEQLAKAGYDASTAGTALRSIIMNLEKQANNDFKPSVVGLTQAFENLGKANLTLTEYQGIAGKMFAAQAKALADAAGEAKKMKEEITGTNIAEEQAKTNTDNLDGSLKSLASAWEGLNLHLNASNGYLRDVVDWLKDVVTWADKALVGLGEVTGNRDKLNNEGGGGQTNVDRQINTLANVSIKNRQATYRQQVEYYWRFINDWDKKLKEAENRKDVFAWETIKKNNDIATARANIEGAKSMLNEYQSRAAKLLSTGTVIPGNTQDSNLGGSGSGGSTTKKTPKVKSDKNYEEGSIAYQEKLVQDLTKQWNEAGADVRDQYLQPLVEAEAKLKEMQNTMDLQKAQAEGKLNGVNLWQGDIDDISGGKTPQFAGSLPDLTKSLQLDNLPQFLSPLQQLNAELEQLRNNLEYAPTTEAYQEGLQAIADKQKEIANFKGIDLSKDADKSAKSFQAAAGAISQVGSALNGIEDPTAKILGIIAQAIASVAAGAGQAVSAKDTTSSGWAWIGAAAAITASMVAMISQIHSATGYAQGGIVDGRGGGFVGGMSYSGDNIGNVRLDSGELVLNRAQQTSLANQLQSSPMSQMQLSAVVTGEQIRLVLNNNGRRTGRGEYVTTNFT